MIVSRRMVFAAIPLSILSASSLQATPKRHVRHAAAKGSSWEGTWRGAWGGKEATAVTIAGNRVVSYEYQGATTPVSASHVTPTRITYGDNGVTVTLTRTSKTTASATLHSSQGGATAELTRQ